MQLANLKQYQPEVAKYGKGVLYFIDENGLDWYESQALFTKKYKLAIDSSGVIRSFATEVSMMYPLNLSIVETDVLPVGFNYEKCVTGNWRWDGANITTA